MCNCSLAKPTYGQRCSCLDFLSQLDIALASAKMGLSSYAGILAGGKRTSPEGMGEDILGGGVWNESILNHLLFVKKQMPSGRPDGAVAPDGPTIQAGMPIQNP